MFPLVNEALNMPADYIFMGDLWGEEAKLWFHEIMAGRGGASSLHAEDSQAAVKMLLSPPMQVDEGAIESLSSIVVMGKFVLKSKGKIVQRRRAINLFDLGPDSTQTSLFRYDLETDSFSFNECSIMESNSAIRMLGGSGLSENALLDQYLKRVSFLRRLMEISKLRPEFREFSAATSAVWDFQASPDDFNPDSLVLSEDDDLNSRERIENQHCMAEGSPRSLLSSTHANFQKSLDMQPAQHAEKDKQLPTQNASALLPIAASASLPMSSAERTGSQSELNAENDDMPAWIRKVSSN